MYSVFRGLTVYLFLLVIFRISGKRSLSQITTFDFVLLLIISEVVQQAMIANDNSMINAFLLVITLVGADILISLWKQRSESVEKLVESVPLIIMENGKLLKDRMDKERIGEGDILSSARELQGLERLDQIKYAILEPNGGITIVPMEQSKKG
jgi:uncharacterized membrane protein YcaP (DUF421 family)